MNTSDNCRCGETAFPRGQSASHPPADGRLIIDRRTVLVIDDDPAVRGALKFSLEIEGFRVLCYASAAEFLQASDLPRRACLVVDEKMPGASGLDMLVSLAHERRATLPAILITSYPSAALRARALAVGVPIVEKPLLNNALSEAIDAAMNGLQN
ncbi:MAG: response regulator transcription factor [Pseudochelatococcus sp.]|uniref:response regulator transcription factor n=1 Tax=Pseudochelatococcus sp. TaxID=2020869 RepID=UPI003D8DB007